MESRLIELEMRVAFQDDTIEQLNHALASQQQALLRIEATLESVKKYLKEQQRESLTGQEGGSEALDEAPPPHY